MVLLMTSLQKWTYKEKILYGVKIKCWQNLAPYCQFTLSCIISILYYIIMHTNIVTKLIIIHWNT